jgi:hypothetical protein
MNAARLHRDSHRKPPHCEILCAKKLNARPSSTLRTNEDARSQHPPPPGSPAGLTGGGASERRRPSHSQHEHSSARPHAAAAPLEPRAADGAQAQRAWPSRRADPCARRAPRREGHSSEGTLSGAPRRARRDRRGRSTTRRGSEHLETCALRHRRRAARHGARERDTAHAWRAGGTRRAALKASAAPSDHMSASA